MSDRYYNYDLSENDPYQIPDSTCLLNLLNITDTQTLNEAEAEITQVTLAGLVNDPVQATFDLSHLQGIHYRIFSEIYPFAGQIRCIEISKQNCFFLPHKKIEAHASQLFNALKEEGYLQGSSANEFAERAGYYLGQINKMHPFREGNGRTQRVFIDQLAALNNYTIEWNAISALAMAEACHSSRTGEDNECRKLVRLIQLNLRTE